MVPDPLAYSLYAFINVDNCELLIINRFIILIPQLAAAMCGPLK